MRRPTLVTACWLAILLLGTGLRLVGLTRGNSDFVLPEQARQGIHQCFYSFHPDEETLIGAALELDNPLRPPLTAYGTLPMLLARLWLKAAALVVPGEAPNFHAAADRAFFFISVRILAALLSCLSLVLVWLLGRRYFGPLAASLAALWVAVAPVAVQQAHFYTVDTLFTFLSLGFFWAALRAVELGRRWHYLLSGVLVGMAAAVRLNGLLLGGVLLAGHLLAGQRAPEESRLAWLRRRVGRPELWLAGLAAVGVLLALEPYLVANPALLRQVDNTDDFAYSLKVASGEILRSWSLAYLHTTPYLHYWTHLWPQAAGWPLTLLFLLGAGYAIWRRGPVRLLLLLWVVLSFLLIGGLLTKHVRYLLPLLPFLSLLAADLGQACLSPGGGRQAPIRRRVGLAVVAAATVSAVLYGVAFARIYAVEDSRVQAGRWLSQQAAEGSAIGVESGGFSLQGVVSQERQRQRYVEAGWLFSTRGYLSCQATYQYLREQVRACDWVAIADVNRYRQYTAAPELFPAGADFYRRLVQGELGFALVQRFKVYPGILGWEFADDQAEPSFLGYDHPAVWILARQESFEADWDRWGREIENCPGCPDRAMRGVAEAVRSGRLGPALEQLQQVRQEYPDLRYVRLVEAYIHRLQGHPDLGEAALRSYLSGYTDLSYGAHLIPWATGLSLVELGLDELALIALTDGVSWKDKFQSAYLGTMTDSYLYLATRLRGRDNRESARQVYEMSLKLSPRPEACNALAEMASAAGNYPEALVWWEKSLELDEAQVKTHLNLGRTACAQGDYARGLSHLGRAVDLDRLLTPAERVQDYGDLAAEAQARGLLDLAASLWGRSLAVDQDQPRARARLEQIRRMLDKPGR